MSKLLGNEMHLVVRRGEPDLICSRGGILGLKLGPNPLGRTKWDELREVVVSEKDVEFVHKNGTSARVLLDTTDPRSIWGLKDLEGRVIFWCRQTGMAYVMNDGRVVYNEEPPRFRFTCELPPPDDGWDVEYDFTKQMVEQGSEVSVVDTYATHAEMVNEIGNIKEALLAKS